jgi:hypothetical protein
MNRLPARNSRSGRGADAPLKNVVKHYTNLTSALDTIKNSHLTILNPRSWDDTNDAHYMELYRKAIGKGSVLALCFTMAKERYHHWKIFAPGAGGVCLELDRYELERRIPSHGAFSGPVDYEDLLKIEKRKTTDVTDLAFLKRQGFRDEQEWRIIATRDEDNLQYCHIPIEIACIKRVILSPWLPEPLKATTRNLIKSVASPQTLSVVASTLTNNSRWKAAGDRLADDRSEGKGSTCKKAST